MWKIDNIVIYNYNMNLALRDKYIDILRQVLEERNMFLLDKQREIKQVSKENKLLIYVAEDYSKYHSILKKQKLEQCAALELLSNYISKISNTMNHTEEVLAQSKSQQQQIQMQMHRLREDIDNLI